MRQIVWLVPQHNRFYHQTVPLPLSPYDQQKLSIVVGTGANKVNDRTDPPTAFRSTDGGLECM